MSPIYTTVPAMGGTDYALSQKVQQLESWKTNVVEPTISTHDQKITNASTTATNAQGGVDTLTQRLNANDAKDRDQDKLAWTGGTQ
ncbi:hypothetical protein E8L90_29660 [Brevibacillus antibioticus]|uniref:Uncharacterized protein n=1 Tax=Brevibacillus antibioticus TaxID=2570228 RepID=A0A4U2XZ89_9BACL|nr:hypothetical protein [Brevibacillus antibioticus]TKI52924.1 hypothetical protein E8L90_29660 [Brevibacillus antibioticus]